MMRGWPTKETGEKGGYPRAGLELRFDSEQRRHPRDFECGGLISLERLQFRKAQRHLTFATRMKSSPECESDYARTAVRLRVPRTPYGLPPGRGTRYGESCSLSDEPPS